MKTKKFKYYFLVMILIQGKIICIGQNGYGPPVFKQDFGFGNSNAATIGVPIPSGKTFFTFENSVCPPPGSYTILRSIFPVQNCFTNTLIGLSHDNNPSID